MEFGITLGEALGKTVPNTLVFEVGSLGAMAKWLEKSLSNDEDTLPQRGKTEGSKKDDDKDSEDIERKDIDNGDIPLKAKKKGEKGEGGEEEELNNRSLKSFPKSIKKDVLGGFIDEANEAVKEIDSILEDLT
jgi:hypothetical protein